LELLVQWEERVYQERLDKQVTLEIAEQLDYLEQLDFQEQLVNEVILE